MTQKDRLGYDPLENFMTNDESEDQLSDEKIEESSKKKKVKKSKSDKNLNEEFDILNKLHVLISGKKNDISLKISGEFTIVVMNKLFENIKDLFNANISIFDLSDVSRIDTAGYQLLCLLLKEKVLESAEILFSKEIKIMLTLYGDEDLLGVSK